MFWAYGRHQEAIAEMEIEVRGYEQGHQGNWPNEDNGVLGDYVHLLEGAHQHAAGEKVLDKYLRIRKTTSNGIGCATACWRFTTMPWPTMAK